MAESAKQDDIDSITSTVDAYQVVARRYRPQTFEQLIGQEHVARALEQAISSGRIGHAYLFTGARGVGKTSAARILAKALNCVTGPTPTPCNECEVCQAVTSGDDVDVIEIDGASNRGIDEIRQLRQNVTIRPSRVRFKIYIIDEVHMLTKEAFNALLKTLEEPPEHVKFIFATTEPNKIPITILSRCQRFDFAGIESASIEQRLAQIAEAEGVQIDEEALALLAMRAAGSMRDSQSLLEQLLAVAGKRITADKIYTLLGIAPGERVEQLVEAVVDCDAAAALAHLDEAIAGGADVGQVVDQLLGYLRDVMAMVIGCDASQLRYVLRSRHEPILALGERLGVHTVLAMIQILDQTAARMRVSVHTRTLAEMALVRLAHLDDLDDLATTIASLESGATQVSASVAASGAKKNGRPVPPITSATAPAASSRPPSPRTVETSRTDPPATTIPSGPVALDVATLSTAWQNVVGGLDGLLESRVEDVSEVRLADDGAVVVKFASHAAMSKEACEQPPGRTTLERSLAEQVGGAVAMRFEIDAMADTSPMPQRRTTPRRQIQAEVAERPFVKKAMELFAADPSKLRVTSPENKK
ncbi:MAG: DNA polymerase III subunit gamma/tau [Aeoliella sp.]